MTEWVTALIIALLEIQFAAFQEDFLMIVEKAREFLAKSKKEYFEEQARKLF